MQIAFQNRSVLLPRDVAFQVRALDIQMRRDFIVGWRGRLPVDPQSPWTCAPYTDLSVLPHNQFYPIYYVPLSQLGAPGAVAFHDDIFGVIYGRIGVPDKPNPIDAVAASHEALELRADPACNLWIPLDDNGNSVAHEVCDPVEGDTYGIDVELLGETKRIFVSNFILPSWFVPNSPGPWDYMGTLSGPLQISQGGYYVKRDHAGNKSMVFGKRAVPMLAKVNDPTSRVFRRRG